MAMVYQVPKDAESPLTAKERRAYARAKEAIKANFRAKEKFDAALMEIRDGRLYRKEYPSFHAFTMKELGVTRQRADQLINALEVRRNLTKSAESSMTTQVVNPLPLPNERQARALATLPAEQQPAVWAQLIRDKGGQLPTGREVDVKVVAWRAAAEVKDVPVYVAGAPGAPPPPVMIKADPRRPEWTGEQVAQAMRFDRDRIDRVIRGLEAAAQRWQQSQSPAAESPTKAKAQARSSR